MSQLHLSDEILMAFADGELDEPVAAAVAKAMAEDPGIAKRVLDFQQSRRLTHQAFSGELAPVPPELHAAVAEQVRAFEAANGSGSEPKSTLVRSKPPGRRPMAWTMAMAASIAALALATGYWAGRQNFRNDNSFIAQLEHPTVRAALSRLASGNEDALPVGRVRAISTYRLANGSVCREFRLQGASAAADAVACHSGQWNVTFALASAAEASYVPSDGADLTTSYLESMAAGEPLVDAAEAKALAEISR